MGMLKGIGRATIAPKATEKQLDYLRMLVAHTGYEDEIDWERITVPKASELIDELVQDAYDDQDEYLDHQWWRDD